MSLKMERNFWVQESRIYGSRVQAFSRLESKRLVIQSSSVPVSGVQACKTCVQSPASSVCPILDIWLGSENSSIHKSIIHIKLHYGKSRNKRPERSVNLKILEKPLKVDGVYKIFKSKYILKICFSV